MALAPPVRTHLQTAPSNVRLLRSLAGPPLGLVGAETSPLNCLTAATLSRRQLAEPTESDEQNGDCFSAPLAELELSRGHFSSLFDPKQNPPIEINESEKKPIALAQLFRLRRLR